MIILQMAVMALVFHRAMQVQQELAFHPID
jgi:hypothetical protein